MKYHVGDIVEGKITGIQPYGAFVEIDKNHKGLIHISEISEDFVKDIGYFVSIHERIKVKIVGIDQSKRLFNLSLKAFHEKPKYYPKFRYEKNIIPTMKLGFHSLQMKLPIWIKETMEEINK